MELQTLFMLPEDREAGVDQHRSDADAQGQAEKHLEDGLHRFFHGCSPDGCRTTGAGEKAPFRSPLFGLVIGLRKPQSLGGAGLVAKMDPRPLLRVSVDRFGREGRQADSDVFGGFGGRILNPLAFVGDDRLPGVDLHHAALVFDPHRSLEDERELVECGALSRLLPAGRTAHVGHARGLGPRVHPPDVLIDQLGPVSCGLDSGRLPDQSRHRFLSLLALSSRFYGTTAGLPSMYYSASNSLQMALACPKSSLVSRLDVLHSASVS